jgi:hypothetical protein
MGLQPGHMTHHVLFSLRHSLVHHISRLALNESCSSFFWLQFRVTDLKVWGKVKSTI